MNARQWSRRRMSRFAAPKCKTFPRWVTVWPVSVAHGYVTRFDWETPEQAYWGAVLSGRGEGTPENVEASYSYRQRHGVCGGSLTVTHVDSDWERAMMAFFGRERRQRVRT